MKKYKVIIFDLDHTLWDYETNALETLTTIHKKYELAAYGGIGINEFIKRFHQVNHRLWDNYNKGAIGREDIRKYRFEQVLTKSGVNNKELARQLSHDYIANCPLKTNLMPYTQDALNYLVKQYSLYLLTNGFDDIQTKKIKKSGIASYFNGMVTSETCGYRKPATEIFEFTLAKAGVHAHEAIMIGDNLKADIGGAKKALIDTVYYNPTKAVHSQTTDFEVACLSELTAIF